MAGYGDDPKANPWPRIPIPDGSVRGIMDTVLGIKETVEVLINRRNSDGFRAVLAREFGQVIDANEAPSTNTSYQVNQGGTTNVNIGRGYDLYAYANGTFSSAETILRVPVVRKIAFPMNFVGSFMRAYAVPSSSCSVTIMQRLGIGGSITIGTVSFVAGVPDGAFFALSAVLNVGDEIEIVAPSTADPTFGNLGFGFLGNRA